MAVAVLKVIECQKPLYESFRHEKSIVESMKKVLENTVVEKTNRPLAFVWCKMTFFKRSVVMPLSFFVHFCTDQAFKMRYIKSLNSQWFQKYHPSNLTDTHCVTSILDEEKMRPLQFGFYHIKNWCRKPKLTKNSLSTMSF